MLRIVLIVANVAAGVVLAAELAVAAAEAFVRVKEPQNPRDRHAAA